MIDRNRELDGKVAIVTGSARNIGRATARSRSLNEEAVEMARGIRRIDRSRDEFGDGQAAVREAEDHR